MTYFYCLRAESTDRLLRRSTRVLKVNIGAAARAQALVKKFFAF